MLLTLQIVITLLIQIIIITLQIVIMGNVFSRSVPYAANLKLCGY